MVLDQKTVASLLIFIAEHGDKGVISNDLRAFGYYNRMVELADLLESKGLLESVKQGSPFKRYEYKITKKGEVIAERMKDMEAYIQGG